MRVKGFFEPVKEKANDRVNFRQKAENRSLTLNRSLMVGPLSFPRP